MKNVGIAALSRVPLVLAVLIIALSTGQALADGTETLGTPSINIASGSGILTAGTGLQIDKTSDFQIDIPLGVDVIQVLLYWDGQMTTLVPGDDTILVNGISVTGALIGGPTYFHTNSYSSAYRADITSLGLVTSGLNTLEVTGMDFNQANNGAGVMVIIDDHVNTAEIGVRDGLDLAFVNFPEPRKSTIKQTFSFLPADEDRSADLTLFASSVAGDSPRPNSIEVTVNGAMTLYSDLMNSNCGQEWDIIELPITVPADVTELSVQVFSRDDNQTGYLPASLSWLCGFLSVETIPTGGGGEGLTPGFWKQPHHFDWWVKYDPSDDYETVFGVDASFTKSLLGALKQGGGGEKALGRHATAGLLNAVSPKVNYLYTEVEVIDMVQEAYLTGNFNDIKDLLEEQNELELGNGDPIGLWLDTAPSKYGEVSASSGSSLDIVMIAKSQFANRQYLVLGSVSGDAPGTLLPFNTLLPMNWDIFTTTVISHINGPVFTDFLGHLDGNARATAQLNTFPVPPVYVGLSMNYAYCLIDPIHVTCGWSVWVEIVP